jgi:hypothetical protein
MQAATSKEAYKIKRANQITRSGYYSSGSRRYMPDIYPE